jgi:uncharacterized lipoprotein YddW (UPF0748 family)
MTRGGYSNGGRERHLMGKTAKFILGAVLVLLFVALGFLAASWGRKQAGQEFVVAADFDPVYLPAPRVPAGGPGQAPTDEPLPEGTGPEIEQAAIPTSEGRALWVPRWSYKSAADVRTIVRKAASANFNILLFQVRGNADAYYSSVYEPWADRLTGTLGRYPGWDPLRLAIDEAHAAGLELHAYINVYPSWLGETPPKSSTPRQMYLTFNSLYGKKWVQWDSGRNAMGLNTSYLAANPGHPAVTEHIVAVCKDIVLNYDVDGVHLDYVRYSGPYYSYDPVSEQRRSDEGGGDRGDWQRAQVTELVGRIYDEVLPLRPGVALSGAVWPIYKDKWGWVTYGSSTYDGYSGFFQDSRGWLKMGKMDFIAPMLYGTAVKDSRDRFKTLVSDFQSESYGRYVYAGIHADYSSFAEIETRINMARRAGCQGQAIFAYSVVESRGYWDEFRAGPYAQPATVPDMPWKQ